MTTTGGLRLLGHHNMCDHGHVEYPGKPALSSKSRCIELELIRHAVDKAPASIKFQTVPAMQQNPPRSASPTSSDATHSDTEQPPAVPEYGDQWVWDPERHDYIRPGEGTQARRATHVWQPDR